jgi:hypothetical protein
MGSLIKRQASGAENARRIHLSEEAVIAKKPRTSGKPPKRGALAMGTPGKPPKAEAKGFSPSPPGTVALSARGQANFSGRGTMTLAVTEGSASAAATEAQAEAAARPTHFNINQVPTPPFNAAPFNNPPLNAAIHSITIEPPFVPPAAHDPALATSPPIIPVTAGSVAVIEGRLSREPAAIGDLARNLSQEFASQAEDLKRSRPNDERRLAQHDDLIDFFERMADGLAQLADALDQAVKQGTGASLDSVSLGKAAEIARGLHQSVMQWMTRTSQLLSTAP